MVLFVLESAKEEETVTAAVAVSTLMAPVGISLALALLPSVAT